MGECIGGCGTSVLDPEGGPSHNVSKQNCSREKAVHPAIHSAAQKDSLYNAGWDRGGAPFTLKL